MTPVTALEDDDRAIRDLNTGWAAADPRRGPEAVSADHADDLVMFEVPPPTRRAGLAAYRNTWPPFLERAAIGGASFEIVSLDVSVGLDVAYA